MAIQPPYGNGPGDIEQAKKKLQGRMPSLAQPVAGNPVRAASMQQQFDQPVANGFAPLQAPLTPAAGAIDRSGANPAGEPYPGPAAIQQRSANLADAVVKDAARRSIADALAVDTPPQAMPGNPERAARMQAQFEQPVTSGASMPLPVTPIAAGASAPSNGMREAFVGGIGGAAKSLVGALGYIPSAAYDGARNAAGSLSGGDTSQIKQYRTGAAALIGEGVGQMSDSAATLRDNAATNTRNTLGIDRALAAPEGRTEPVKAPATDTSSGGAGPAIKPVKPGKPGTAPEQPAGNGYTQTGIDGIVARVGANGVPEFTNNQAAASGASALPEGGIGGKPLRTPGVSNMADDVPLARRGSINNIGNGIGGGLSVGEDGDAQMAIGRFERANQIRAEMNASRPREIGDNGGRVSVVRDSSRAPSIAEMVNERRGRADASADLDQRQVVNDERRTDADIARNNQQATNDQLTQQKTRQEIEAGRLALDGDVRMNSIRAQLADPAIAGEQRAILEQAYATLTTPAKDRYIRQKTISGVDGVGQPLYEEQVIDVTTGRPVGSSTSRPVVGTSARKSVTAAEVEKTARDEGMTTKQVIELMKAQGVKVDG